MSNHPVATTPTIAHAGRGAGSDIGLLTVSACVIVGASVAFSGTAAAVFAGPLGMALCVALLVGAFAYDRLLGFATLVCVTLLQNFSLALLAENIQSRRDLNLLQGLNFLALATFGGIALLEMLRSELQETRRTARGVAALLAILVVYAGIGAARESVLSAAAYFRYYSNGILFICAGYYVAMQYRPAAVSRVVGYALAISAAITVLELVFGLSWYTLVGIDRFMQVKREYQADFDLTAFVAQRFLNLPFFDGMQSYRALGTVIHHVSQGYVLAALVVLAVGYRKYLLAAGAFVLVVTTGVKGAIILSLFCPLFVAANRLPPFLFKGAFVAWAAVYISGAIVVGLLIQDQHVIGLLTAIRKFPSAPFGVGLGVGGNLADSTVEAYAVGQAWEVWRESGAAEHALESAVGVLLYQVGIPAIALVVFLVRVVRDGLARANPEDAGIARVIAIALTIVLTNGLFQEEAASPYGSGLLLSISGALLARAHHSGTTPGSR